MNQPLRVLIVENSHDDVALLLHALRRGGYAVTSALVETPAAMRAALTRQAWDVITSEHAMPHFSAPAALALAQELCPDVPFIIVSGKIDLDLAVSLMRGGAQDYISKGELARLVPAIERELRDVEVRRARQQVEDALRVSETRYRRLFETAQDGILILDAGTHTITDVNPFMVELLGYTRDEFLGKALWEIGVLTDAAASWEAFRTLQATGYIRYDDLPLQTKAGARQEVEFVSNMYRENDHEVIQCNIRDITARRKAEEARAQLAAMVESSDDAIIGKTLDGRITSWNAGAERLYGYPRAEVIGQSIALLIPPDRSDELPTILARLQRGERIEHFETVRMRKDGTHLEVSLTVSPIIDAAGHVVGASAIARDITARRQAEAQVQRQREALFQSEKLATMGQLLAGVAHELNNPLSVVMGQAALLQHAMRDKQQAEQAAKIVQAAERCARIVHNFLALARQQPPERQSVHLNQVVREVVELFAYSLRVDSVDVHFELAPDLPVVGGDRHQLHQVMVNLVTNAQQAMREVAGPRHLTLATGVDAEGRQIWLEVRDTGPGVAAAAQEHIFKPFVTTKPPGMGTGLGLSLCQEIVEEHGGTIRLGQADPQGAVFRVTLPVAAPHGAALEAPPPVGVAAIRGKRVLVVDDEPGIASVVAEVLALDGHVVEIAAHGGEALAKVRAHTYDLILSDIRMPEVDGPNFYRELARWDSQLLPRLMFLTGDTLNASTREFLEQTGVPCVRKPFTLAEIRAVVQQILQAREEAPADG
jgi:two-component system NtrC family sensor kinase